MRDEMHSAIATRLRRIGQRYTSKRRSLVDALDAVGNPPTIPEILAGNAELATSSVYRNLAVLEQAGVVHRIVTHDEFARYELAEDLTERHHHHLICTACGGVQDFTPSPQLEQSAARALSRIARQAEFTVSGHRIDVVGLCNRCA